MARDTRIRSAGILCHPISMPSTFGIGDLGQGPRLLIDFVSSAGLSLWQILPLGPTGYGDSPYQPFSAFAGNPLLIDPLALRDDGLLSDEDLSDTADIREMDTYIDYGKVIHEKHRLLRKAFAQQRHSLDAAWADEMEAFAEANEAWLPDYCLFMALKAHFNWVTWTDWPDEIALRSNRSNTDDAVAAWRDRLRNEVDYHAFLQFLFDRQWAALKAYAEEQGVRIIGDMPLYMGHDSADVWAHQELFRLDEQGRPTVVAGVPPDYFSATGQRWGNPHYRWERMAEDGYAWWMQRLQRTLSQVHMVRLDHFRGFAGYWEVPASEETAVRGRWVQGPGAMFFRRAQEVLGELPIIAEDLGTISPDVHALRERFGLPGMRVLQFAFDAGASSPHLPHNYTPDTLVYTGTHDNDTTLGWYCARDYITQHRVRVYTGTSGEQISWALIRLAMTSVADMAIFPLQDVLGLGSEARLNVPGRPHGNWTWRFIEGDLRPELAHTLRELANVTSRLAEKDVEQTECTDTDEVDYQPSYTDTELADLARNGSTRECPRA
jgi:4-alpha-glucanotransferase